MTTLISLITATALLCVGCASQGVVPAPERSAAETAPTAAGPSPGARAGMRVYKDPQTGAFTDPPPATTAPAAVEAAIVHSHDGLVAVPNTAVPGGGVKMDLQGRFRNHFIATKDADGKVSIRCVPEQELPKP